MPECLGASPGLYSLSNCGLTLTSMSLPCWKSVTDRSPWGLNGTAPREGIKPAHFDRLAARVL